MSSNLLLALRASRNKLYRMTLFSPGHMLKLSQLEVTPIRGGRLGRKPQTMPIESPPQGQQPSFYPEYGPHVYFRN